MIKEQRYILGIGLLALTIVLTFVPFESTANRDGDNSRAYEGYAFLWSPPSPVIACLKTFGMPVNPSDSHERIVQKANRTCYVAPAYSRLIVSAIATAVLTFATWLLVGALRSKDASLLHQEAPTPLAQKQTLNQDLAQQLLQDLGETFPVSSGNAKKDDPLIITELVDHVAIEYMVVKHVLSTLREQYELESQSLINEEDRYIDELVFRVKANGANDWSGRRRFYFDITKGYENLTRST